MRGGLRYVVEIKPRVILVRGFQAGDRLRGHGMKPLWSGVGRGWVLDRKRLPDVRAMCDYDGIGLREVEADAA